MSHSSLAVALLAGGHSAVDLMVGGHAAILGSPGLTYTEMRSALVMGLTYGLVHAVGPDHIATLMTLASATSPASAFRVGASWGLGHSFGIVMMAGLFVVLHRFVSVNLEKWEHYGNYFIGASMMACGLYFILNESSFLKEEEDGTIVALGCACHGAPQSGGSAWFRCITCDDAGGAEAQAEEKLPWTYCTPCKKGARAGIPWPEPDDEPDAVEGQPLLAAAPKEQPEDESAQQGSWWQRLWAERDVKGALLGVFQGFCCPLGLLGISFMANLPPQGIAAFLIVFLFVSAFGTASLALAWACISAWGFGTVISPRTVFRASCAVTVVLGVAWIACNKIGIIDKLDYTEGLEAPGAPPVGEPEFAPMVL